MIFGKMNEMLIKKENINLIIPQQQPFVMIDNLIECEAERVLTNFIVRKENALFENNHFSESGMLENMAQTAAAYLGYDSYIKVLPPKVGFIAAVKNFEISSVLNEFDEIYTEAIYTQQVLNIHIVNATIFCNKKPIAKAELRIFINE